MVWIIAGIVAVFIVALIIGYFYLRVKMLSDQHDEHHEKWKL
jgi:hypothetical protein